MAEPKGRADVAVFAAIGAIERLATQRAERVLPQGLSSTGLELLNQLAMGAAQPTPQALASALKLSKPAITHTLQRLERQGLVDIAADRDDRRRKRISLTPAGLGVYRAALTAVRPEMEVVREAFGAEAFASALPFLERLAGWLGANP
jgi:DNA-binding MarR family transcriptional regulator